MTAGNGFATNCAVSVALECMTKLSAALSDVMLPTQFERMFPALGVAVIVYRLPTSSILPFRLGVTVPPPDVLTMIGSMTTWVTDCVTVADSQPVASIALTRILFGPARRSSGNDHAVVPMAG